MIYLDVLSDLKLVSDFIFLLLGRIWTLCMSNLILAMPIALMMLSITVFLLKRIRNIKA